MTLQEQLDEAKREYHALMVGLKARVVVDANGERVEFTVANRAALLAYIQELEAQLVGVRTSGPARVFF